MTKSKTQKPIAAVLTIHNRTMPDGTTKLGYNLRGEIAHVDIRKEKNPRTGETKEVFTLSGLIADPASLKFPLKPGEVGKVFLNNYIPAPFVPGQPSKATKATVIHTDDEDF